MPAGCSPRIARVERLQRVGNVVLEFGAVGHVQVDVQNRIPGAQQAQHRLHLGRIRLHVVAIEIEVRAVARQPISSGPTWLGRFQCPKRS